MPRTMAEPLQNDMTDDDLDEPEGDENGDQESNEPTLADWVGMGAGALWSLGDRSGADEFVKTEAADEIEDADLERIRSIRPEVADALSKARDEARTELDRLEQERRAADRETRKADLKALPPDERTPENDVDRELIAELADEEHAASPEGQVESQVDATVQEIGSILADIKTGKVEFEEGYQQVQDRVGAARELADRVTDRSLTTAERVDLWGAADAVTRGVAEQLFGIVPTFGVDVNSDEYKAALAERREANNEDAQWAARQLGLGEEEH